MPGHLCSHCGHENREEDSYCKHCGAFRESTSVNDPSTETQHLEHIQEDTEGIDSDSAQESADLSSGDTPTEIQRNGDKSSPQQPTLVNVLSGLIPERELSHFGSIWAPPRFKTETTHPSLMEDMRKWFSMANPTVPYRLTGRLPTESIHSQWLLYAAIFLAALLPFWIGPSSVPAVPYSWEGTGEAWQAIQNLEPGSRVLIFWQSDPAVSGELDLPLTPVLTHLLAIPADLHLLSQHPLGLAQAKDLLGTVRRRQAVVLSEAAAPASIHEIGYWPGGYVVLPGLQPWLATLNPDLQVLVTANANDVIHWLEQVAPYHTAPVIAVTSAGIDQLIRPYQDSQQLVGVVRGYSGAQEYSQLNASRFPNLQTEALAFHKATQNWVTTTLILFFLAALLLRHYAPLPWKKADIDS